MTGLRWIASYPKSGNTWLRHLLHYHACPDRAEEALDPPLAPFLSIRPDVFDDLTGATSSDLDTDAILARRPGFHAALAETLTPGELLKTHDCAARIDGQPLFHARSSAGAVYLVRNPLDVAVSYASHANRSPAEIVTHMADPDCRIGRRGPGMATTLEQFLGSWSHNVVSWADWRAFPVIVLRYEDLAADPEGRLREVLDFLGWDSDARRIRAAVEAASFTRLRERERARGFAIRTHSGAPFFRRGRAGTWRDELPRALAERILADHGPAMARFGYADEAGNWLSGTT